MTIVIVALELVPLFETDYLLVVVKYVLRLGASFNNWPMVTIILLSNICCPILFFTSKAIGASSTSGCSMVDGNPVHSMDQDGSRIVATSYCTFGICSSFCNS